ncbi:uncharacterized protein ARMOST_01706 [Armillaria ostoyae]|uniref:Uncharacterized protein n=1 Tax=Armillaria ostoyae TaxID=47428 RepID=A0A284QPP7_ARMOS|nr:uncharacterized protein ARMOST_01706 [Armillaria ostoyae]
MLDSRFLCIKGCLACELCKSLFPSSTSIHFPLVHYSVFNIIPLGTDVWTRDSGFILHGNASQTASLPDRWQSIDLHQSFWDNIEFIFMHSTLKPPYL